MKIEKRIKCGIYINNAGVETVDCSNVHYGNPGIGGTEYASLLLADWLSLNKSSKFSVTVYIVSREQKLPSSLKIRGCDLSDALKQAVQNGEELFVSYYDEGMLYIDVDKLADKIIY